MKPVSLSSMQHATVLLAAAHAQRSIPLTRANAIEKRTCLKDLCCKLYMHPRLVTSGCTGPQAGRTHCAICIKTLLDVQVALGRGYRQGVTVQLRFFVWPALLSYALAAYTAVRFALAHESGHTPPQTALAVSRCVQAAVVVAVTITETIRCA